MENYVALSIFFIWFGFNPLKLTFCGHFLRIIDNCPSIDHEWINRRQLCHGLTETYHCILVNRTQLGEICMARRGLSSQYCSHETIENGEEPLAQGRSFVIYSPQDLILERPPSSQAGCPYMNMQEDPNFLKEPKFFPCPVEEPGCPGSDDFYISDELYKFPACLPGQVGTTYGLMLDSSSNADSLTTVIVSEKANPGNSNNSSTEANSGRKGEANLYMPTMTSSDSRSKPNVIGNVKNLSDLNTLNIYFIAGGAILSIVIMNLSVWCCFYLKKRRKASPTSNSNAINENRADNSSDRIYDDIVEWDSSSRSVNSYLEPCSILKHADEGRRLSVDVLRERNRERQTGNIDEDACGVLENGHTLTENVVPYERLDLFKAFEEREKSLNEDYSQINKQKISIETVRLEDITNETDDASHVLEETVLQKD